MKDLSIIIVSYNCRDYLQACLKSVFNETPGLEYEVLVVDNNSSDGGPELVGEYFPQARLFKNEKNLGFAQANNQAILQATGRYIMLLNPDTIIQSNALGKLVSFMDEKRWVSAVGPRLMGPDGTIQRSIRKFPSVVNQLAQCVFLHRAFPGVERFAEMVWDERRYGQTQKVDWLTGAALMVRQSVIQDVGLIDEDYFLYGEEQDWCLRMKKSGLKVYYYAGAQIIHYGRDISLDIVNSKRAQRAILLLWRKHYGRTTVLAFRLIFITALMIRLIPKFSAREKLRVHLDWIKYFVWPKDNRLSDHEEAK